MSAPSTTTAPDPSAQASSIVAGGAKIKIDAILMLAFTSAIFTSATLLFVVQPMVGKLLLPKLGGASAVWNTCMLFFQATLLAGYFAAHQITKRLGFKSQVFAFSITILLAMTTLPLGVSQDAIDRLLAGANPTLWLLGVLAIRVAPAFFVLSITSPLLQRWFAESGHASAKDPYFLYAASNVGSILALMAYPLLIETNLGVSSQAASWMFGFGLFAILISVCGCVSWIGSQREGLAKTKSTKDEASGESLTWQRRGFWILMAFVPSSLMLGVTTYLSTDVASIPLIWVVPLAMYLLTFVFAFASRQIFSAYLMGRLGALLILAITLTMLSGASSEPLVVLPMHLMMFFAVAMFCHQRLASDRPSAARLTDFYLCLSIGGVCGGIFNALIAPSVFPTIIEYPIVMLLATLLRPGSPNASDQAKTDFRSKQTLLRTTLYFVGIFAGTILLNWAFSGLADRLSTANLSLPLTPAQLCNLFIFGIPAGVVLMNLERRIFFTVGLLAIYCVGLWNQFSDASVLQHSRNFYGTIGTGAEDLPSGRVTKMFHGNTVHGWQWHDNQRRNLPLTYYGQQSGIHKVLTDQAAHKSQIRVGAIGLGAGTLAALARPNDSIIYYEINPQVLDHAERYFHFLSDARKRGASVDVRLGDARLVLEQEVRKHKPGNYDVLVADAFSSDSIPTHLLTTECLDVYLAHTATDGVIAVHISNRYLDLEPVLAALASQRDLAAFTYKNLATSRHDGSGETKSIWVLMSRSRESITRIKDAPFLKPAKSRTDLKPWTDDFTNILDVITLSDAGH